MIVQKSKNPFAFSLTVRFYSPLEKRCTGFWAFVQVVIPGRGWTFLFGPGQPVKH